jgi:hypothetical protein
VINDASEIGILVIDAHRHDVAAAFNLAIQYRARSILVLTEQAELAGSRRGPQNSEAATKNGSAGR